MKSKTAKWFLDICDRLYAQNRQVKSLYDEARYLEGFYIDYSDYCGDPDRLKPSLKDLVRDNDKLVLGLEQVVTLLCEYLAKARRARKIGKSWSWRLSKE